MRIATFIEMAGKYAAVMGRRNGVIVKYEGDVAKTDGRVVTLPALPAGTEFTPQQRDVYEGYLDHEVGHVRVTDFSELQKNWGLCGENFDPILNHLVQVIEDVREENVQIDQYPGSRRVLDALAEEVDSQSRSREESLKKTDLAKEIMLFMSLFYKEAWVRYRGVLHTTVGPDGWLEDHPAYESIASLMQGIPKLRSTAQSFLLAKQIKNLIPPSLMDKMKQEQDKKKASGMGDGSGGFSGKSGQNPSLQEMQVALKQLTEALAKAKDRGEAFNAMMKVVDKKNKQDDEASKPSYGRSGRGSEVLPPATLGEDRVFVPSGKSRHQYLEDKNELSPEISSLKKMMRIYLQTQTHSSWVKGLREGQLDTTALWKLQAGSRNLKKQVRTRPMIDTAVLLLLDLSSSMSSPLVRKTAIAVAEATSTIGQLKLAVAGFTTRRNNLSSLGSGSLVGVGRLDPMDILLFKGFDEAYSKACDRFGEIRTSGYTPLGDAYGKALEFISQRKEPRLVVWIVSDGEPFFYKGDERHDDKMLMARIHQKCKRHKVETIGLGIIGSYPLDLSRFVDRYGEITNEADLPAAVLKGLKGVV